MALIDMSTVITVKNLGKKYVLSHQTQKKSYVALRDVIADNVRDIGRRFFTPFSGYNQAPGTRHQAPGVEDFWALKDVSFEIKQGERVGIIGRNGAGKSTFLKILSRIVELTEGRVRLKGRVASLLEVGTGFHPELTGRENIFLNGAILGMTRMEIKKKFDEIVDFAEIEKFLDTPVKRYSSGMYVRLAFAVAAHLEPEILLVDEVLAVGDAQFQKKCLGKMAEVAGEGRTILFVSHNMAAVNQLCTRTIWIQGGMIELNDATFGVVQAYLTSGASCNGERYWELAAAPGNDKIRLRAVRIRDDHDAVSSIVRRDMPFSLELEYDILRPYLGIRTGFWLNTAEGILLFVAGDNEDVNWNERERPRGHYLSKCTIPAGLLNSGNYTITAAADIPGLEMLFVETGAISFTIEHTDVTKLDGANRSPGLICPSLSWQITAIDVAG
jgi:lipopolysaccharide transport system ATP-binding protein